MEKRRRKKRRRKKRSRKKIPNAIQVRSHRRSLVVHPTRFQALASPFPATTHSRSVIRTEGAACRPWARLPSPSRVPLRHLKARALQRANHITQVMWRQRPLPHPLWWLPHFGCFSHLVRAEPSGCTRHPHAPTPSSCCRWPSMPLDSTKSCLPYTSGSHGHETTTNVRGRRQLRQSIGSEVSHESDHEDVRASRSGHPSPDGSLEAREREGSVGLLSPPSSQPSPRTSLGSRDGSTTSLAQISGTFQSSSRSRNTSTGSGSGSGGSS